MAISFIITTYNVAPYIGDSLASIAAVARPGDEVILVDDGSDDGTAGIAQAFLARGALAEGVDVTPIWLGANTMGGVGIGANIGLSAARCDTVFFVDGDDWIDAEGFGHARSHWEARKLDILLTNYLEFDQKNGSPRPPADAGRWRLLDHRADRQKMRDQALSFIAVPWRKFYRRDFIERHGLRFPEGDFFFEDNPFHWAVCLAAESIGFIDRIACHHRINRPGQTMTSTGTELAAFFTHYATILRLLPPGDAALQEAAAGWLLGNMSWHLPRLKPNAQPAYAQTAARTLAQIPEDIWTRLAASRGGSQVWTVAERLRMGDVWGQIDAWDRAALVKKLDRVEARIKRLESDIKRVGTNLHGLDAARSFQALSQLHRMPGD